MCQDLNKEKKNEQFYLNVYDIYVKRDVISLEYLHNSVCNNEKMLQSQKLVRRNEFLEPKSRIMLNLHKFCLEISSSSYIDVLSLDIFRLLFSTILNITFLFLQNSFQKASLDGNSQKKIHSAPHFPHK